MTAGHGIAHSEETPERRHALLHGVQLWVALPDRDRDVRPPSSTTRTCRCSPTPAPPSR